MFETDHTLIESWMSPENSQVTSGEGSEHARILAPQRPRDGEELIPESVHTPQREQHVLFADPEYQKIYDQVSATPDIYAVGYSENRRDIRLREVSVRLFKESHPDIYAGYIQQEQTRVYEDLQNDPAIWDVESNIMKFAQYRFDGDRKSGLQTTLTAALNVESNQKWRQFAYQFPEKAQAYADKGHEKLQKALRQLEDQRQKELSKQMTKAESVRLQLVKIDDIASGKLDLSRENVAAQTEESITIAQEALHEPGNESSVLELLTELDELENAGEGTIQSESGSPTVKDIFMSNLEQFIRAGDDETGKQSGSIETRYNMFKFFKKLADTGDETEKQIAIDTVDKKSKDWINSSGDIALFVFYVDIITKHGTEEQKQNAGQLLAEFLQGSKALENHEAQAELLGLAEQLSTEVSDNDVIQEGA